MVLLLVVLAVYLALRGSRSQSGSGAALVAAAFVKASAGLLLPVLLAGIRPRRRFLAGGLLVTAAATELRNDGISALLAVLYPLVDVILGEIRVDVRKTRLRTVQTRVDGRCDLAAAIEPGKVEGGIQGAHAGFVERDRKSVV